MRVHSYGTAVYNYVMFLQGLGCDFCICETAFATFSADIGALQSQFLQSDIDCLCRSAST